MFVFALKLFSGLAFVSIIWMVRGERSLSSSASSDNKTVRIRQRRENAIILSNKERISFLQIHNEIRKDVGNSSDPKKPAAARMMRMYWNAQLEANAVSRSMKCYTGGKDCQSGVGRLKEFTSGLSQYGGTIGYNLYAVENRKPTVSEVLTQFANTSEGFEYSKEKGVICKGRADCKTYTQMIWQSSFLVGCGYAKCKDVYIVTCNYLPGGNEEKKVPYEDGTSCSHCASDHQYSFTQCEGEHLCVPKDKCSPVKECHVVDGENCLCSEEDYNLIVSRMVKATGAIHVGPPAVVFGLLLPLVATLLGQGVQPCYDSGLM